MDAVKGKTKNLALSGILLALSVVFLYLKTLLSVFDLSILILISFFTGIILIESGIRWAFLFFISLSGLSLILPVNKLEMLLFYSFFGYYGIVKFYIEKIKSNIVVFAVKALLITAVIIINYYFASAFLPFQTENGIKFYLLLPIAFVFIFIYDYIYTLAMVFYNKNIKRGSKNV